MDADCKFFDVLTDRIIKKYIALGIVQTRKILISECIVQGEDSFKGYIPDLLDLFMNGLRSYGGLFHFHEKICAEGDHAEHGKQNNFHNNHGDQYFHKRKP